jgi:hypothetical protein
MKPIAPARRVARDLLLLLAAGLALGTAPEGRFDAGTDTVLDRATGLTWQRAVAPSTYTWATAKTYCESLTLAGYSDWRLPSVRELSTLVDPRTSQPAIERTIFPSTPADKFWTATAYAPATGSAWTVVFNDGGVLQYAVGELHYVRCVR